MPSPLPSALQKIVGPYAGKRLVRFVVGIGQDFWKDGTEHPFQFFFDRADKKAANKTTAEKAPKSSRVDRVREKEKPTGPKVWHAEPGEISEKMWGAECVTPGDNEVTEMLIQPLGLNKDLSVLDLSAGLGGRLRRTTEKYGVYITGLEPDPQVAARGMELSVKAGKAKRAAIAAYDPANFSVDRRYDCIIARETFYRISERAKFMAALSACCKPGAQLSFTDYIVNPEDREKPGIVAWMQAESGANPLGLVEMAQEWAKVGFSLRVHDDQTVFYKKEVMEGMKRIAIFLMNNKPDAETKASLRRRMESWVLRLTALEQGMKFYRFYGTKL